MHNQFLGNNSLSNYLYQRIINNNLNSKNYKSANHIFITGLARSGTTALLNKLYSSGEIPSLLYKHMPFILYPSLAKIFSNFINDDNNLSIERFHKDGIKINNNSPECLDEVFWLKSFDYKNNSYLFRYKKISKNILNGYGSLLSKYAKIQNSERILIKNNNNHLRIEILSNFFKRSTFFIMFRDPIYHSLSLLNSHKILLNFKIKINSF